MAKPNTRGMIGRLNYGLYVNKDSDGDGYPNWEDCKPYDKNKQGILHDIKSRTVTAAKDRIQEWRQKHAAERQIRKKARAEYFRAKERESMQESRDRAKVEREARVKKYKERLNRKPMPIFGAPVAKKTYTYKRKKKPKKRKKIRKTTQARDIGIGFDW